MLIISLIKKILVLNLKTKLKEKSFEMRANLLLKAFQIKLYLNRWRCTVK